MTAQMTFQSVGGFDAFSGSRKGVPHIAPGIVKLWVPPRQSRESPAYAGRVRELDPHCSAGHPLSVARG